MTINRFGRFSYKHQMDTSWDVSEWLLETRNHLTTWCDVYWYIWGTINHLECSRCLETFPCTEYSNCRYHPERAVFEPYHLTGEHPCCGLKVQRFDPLQPNKVSLPSTALLLLLLFFNWSTIVELIYIRPGPQRGTSGVSRCPFCHPTNSDKAPVMAVNISLKKSFL